MPKRKRDKSTNPKLSTPTCIIHMALKSDPGNFTPLSNVKGSPHEKLQHLHEIREQRLYQPYDSPYRMQAVCDQIPTALPDDLDTVGYHRQCYQRFTSNLHLLSSSQSEPEPSTSHHSPRKSFSGGSTGPIFPPECIFCNKLEVKTRGRKTERAEVFSSYKNMENAWEQIESRSEKLGLLRLHRQVKNKDLFACEAKRHFSCLQSFRTTFANYERGIHRSDVPHDTNYAQMSAAHDKAIISVLNYIELHVVQENEVLRLSTLRSMYVSELTRNGYENSNYRSEKLLKRLQNDPIKDHVSFAKVNDDKPGAISFWLVYNSNITVSNALERAYTLGGTDMYQDIALRLRS